MGDSNTAKIPNFQSFQEFFPYYLGEHQLASTKALHFFGLVVGLPSAIWVGLFMSLWGWALLPVAGYGFAWFAHFFIEKNRPATFKYPLWSIMGDFYMCYWVIRKRSFHWTQLS